MFLRLIAGFIIGFLVIYTILGLLTNAACGDIC